MTRGFVRVHSFIRNNFFAFCMQIPKQKILQFQDKPRLFHKENKQRISLNSQETKPPPGKQTFTTLTQNQVPLAKTLSNDIWLALFWNTSVVRWPKNFCLFIVVGCTLIYNALLVLCTMENDMQSPNAYCGWVLQTKAHNFQKKRNNQSKHLKKRKQKQGIGRE